MAKIALIIGIGLILSSSLKAAKTGEINYSNSITASEASEWFFGKSTPPAERIKLALNVGRINARLGTKLKCGNLSLDANLGAEFEKLQEQLQKSISSLEDMITGGGAAVAVVCYYKPNVCAHMRHFSAMIQEELNIQMDACRSVDNFISEQAEKGQKELRAKATQDCIDEKGPEISPSVMRECLKSEGTARNLLSPFSKKIASGKQKVLSSILEVVNESEDYNLWAQMLGEVELHKNGYWSKAFPKDQLKPDSYVDNVMIASQKASCDPARLRAIISSKEAPNTSDFDKYVTVVIREKLTKDTIYSLESLPKNERAMACTALGESLAALAVKRFKAKGESAVTSALASDALPDQLSEFYADRSQMTFSAIDSKLASKEIRPLSEVIERIGRLGAAYRKKSREDAADITINKLKNKDLENQCTDAFSCEE